MNPEYKKAGYLLDDFRLFHLNEKQIKSVDYHYHDFYKLFLLLSGSGVYSIEGKRYLVTDGDFIFVGKHQIHRPEFDSDFPYERIIIYISPDFLDGHSVSGCNLEQIFDGTWGHHLKTDENQRQLLFRLLHLLEEELENDHYGRSIMSNSILMQLLIQISRNLQKLDSTRINTVFQATTRTLNILRYIEENISEEISIDALAEHFFVSKYHMMRSFKEEIGQSIHHYIIERRLLLAKSLINKGISATESCYQAGFKSYSSFTRAYRKRFSTTPTGRIDTKAKLEETYE